MATNSRHPRADSTKALQTSPLLQEVIHIETEIGKLRSVGMNYSNYVPALRVLDSIKETLCISPGPAYGRDIGTRRLKYVPTFKETKDTSANTGILDTTKCFWMSSNKESKKEQTILAFKAGF